MEMLKEITEVPGVSGFEGEVAKVIEKYGVEFGTIMRDNLGSIILRKEGDPNGPKVMLAGHMDEIGFIVTHITKEGYLKFLPLGGWWDQVMLAHRVNIITSNGMVPGVIGSKPPHILSPEDRKKMLEKKDMFIDIGAFSDSEAKEKYGIRLGDPIVPDSTFKEMANPDIMMAKAWDNRVGCAIFLDVIKLLSKDSHPNTVYGVGTVQEEVGLRGAKTSAELVNPDIAFALEVSIAGDIPGVKEEEAQDKLGKGPSIIFLDGSMIPNGKLRSFVEEIAKDKGIPLQFSSMPGGGTDAGRIHLHGIGVPSLVIGIPSRYIHSHTSLIHKQDYINGVKLLVEVIKRLDKDTVNSFTK